MYKLYQRLREAGDLDFSDEDVKEIKVVNFDIDDISLKNDKFLIVKLTSENYKYVEELENLDLSLLPYRYNNSYIILDPISYNLICLLDFDNFKINSMQVIFSKNVSMANYISDENFKLSLDKHFRLHNYSGNITYHKSQSF